MIGAKIYSRFKLLCDLLVLMHLDELVGVDVWMLLVFEETTVSDG